MVVLLPGQRLCVGACLEARPAADAAAMTAGPQRKRIAMVEVAAEVPQAMSFGCMAMNSPGQQSNYKLACFNLVFYQ
jgi:hypothetical protein